MKLLIAKLKYYWLRRWLIEEMTREGWRADPTEPQRLMLKDEQTKWNMAQHEAVSRHFKEYPLMPDKREGM